MAPVLISITINFEHVTENDLGIQDRYNIQVITVLPAPGSPRDPFIDKGERKDKPLGGLRSDHPSQESNLDPWIRSFIGVLFA